MLLQHILKVDHRRGKRESAGREPFFGGRQHSQEKQEELGILLATGWHQRSTPIPSLGMGWGHRSSGTMKDREKGSGCRDCPMGKACAAASLWLPSAGIRLQLSRRRYLGTQGERKGEGCWQMDSSAPE